MTDNDIICGIRENSASAWRELFASTHDRFVPQISAILKTAKDTTYDDIYEMACMDLMDNVKDGKLVEGENVNLSGYLYIICYRRAIRAESSRKIEENRHIKIVRDTAEDEASEKDAPDVRMEYNPDREALADADAEDKAKAFLDKVLSAIPDSCRQLLRRYYWDKMSMKEIAAIMGLKNDDVAKATKNKCMNKFKNIAKAMLEDDAKTEEAVRRAIERDALRDLLEECRNEASGDWAIAALKEKDKKK